MIRTGQRWAAVGVAVVLVATVLAAVALLRHGDDDSASALTVTWGGSEGHPSCVYDTDAHSVDCRITVDGEVSKPDEVTVTVTAYADENTSSPVGSASRTVHAEGTMHTFVVVTIPVEKAPHVDEDGETACRLSVTRSAQAARSMSMSGMGR